MTTEDFPHDESWHAEQRAAEGGGAAMPGEAPPKLVGEKALPREWTLERARIVNALVNAAQLRVDDPVAKAGVADSKGQRYAVAGALVEDVSLALGISQEVARKALVDAVHHGQLDVPPDLPASEHPITFVRPSTL